MKRSFQSLLVGVVFLALAASAGAQGYVPNFYQTIDIPASPSIIAASSTSNITTTPITVRQGSGHALFARIGQTNAGTATATFHFDVSYDGTNFTTTQPLKLAVVGNGTTGVTGFTNFNENLLSNVRSIKLSAIQNAHTASLFVTNVVESHRNN